MKVTKSIREIVVIKALSREVVEAEEYLRREGFLLLSKTGNPALGVVTYEATRTIIETRGE